MKGDPKVLEYLKRHQESYRDQTVLLRPDAKNWGLQRMAKHEYEESIEEMKHADRLIERILMLDGLPNLQDLGKLLIGESAVEILDCDLRAELDSQLLLKEAMAYGESVRDYVSRDILGDILEDTEEHSTSQTQIRLVAKVGEQNWLQSQMGDPS